MSAIFKRVKPALKMIFKGTGCFQFLESVVTSTAKESLRFSVRGSLQVYRYYIGVVTAMNHCNRR